MNKQKILDIVLVCLGAIISIVLIVFIYISLSKKGTSVNSCSNNCNDNGNCTNGICNCNTGYTGVDCNQKIPISVCPNDCSNQGYCVDGKCDCNPGYKGVDCSLVCPGQYRDCNGNGTCQDNGTCKCIPKWSGLACDTTCPGTNGDCNNNGLCGNDGKCICNPTYSGADCLTQSCPNNCSSHGVCTSNFTCVCSQNYTGNSCGNNSNWPICVYQNWNALGSQTKYKTNVSPGNCTSMTYQIFNGGAWSDQGTISINENGTASISNGYTTTNCTQDTISWVNTDPSYNMTWTVQY